jgi:FkbM family methyltransferase
VSARRTLAQRATLAARPLIDRLQLPGSRALIERGLRGACGEIDVTLSTGVTMRVDLTDRVQRLEAFRAYERRELALMLRMLRPDHVMFDLGAHVGYYALHAASVVRDVHAFEPLPTNAVRLQRNVHLNGFTNVTVNEAAVGERAGRARFGAVTTAGESGWGSLTAPADDQTHDITVDVVALDEYVKERSIERIDLIKMDVQGAEADALRGAKDSIARWMPDILTEAVEGCAWQYGHDVAGFVRFVKELGYRVWSFPTRGAAIEAIGDEPAGPVLFLSTRAPDRR